jgi:hypothetical protein
LKCVFSDPNDPCELCLELGKGASCGEKRPPRKDKEERERMAKRTEFQRKLFQYAEERLEMGQTEQSILDLIDPRKENQSNVCILSNNC